MKNFENWLHAIKWANVGVGLAHFVGIAAGAFPANPWLIALQGIIATAMPSVFQGPNGAASK